MADIGWRRRRGSSPAARRGARQRAGLTPASASNTLSCQRETLHSQQLKSIKKSIDSDHGIYRDLRNVVANYPFERSRGFPGSEPNCGHGDYSRLSCSAGMRTSGLGSAGSSANVLHGRWPSRGVAEKARIGRDLFRSEDGPAAAKPATPLLSLRWTFRAKRACVVITDAEPARLAPLTPP